MRTILSETMAVVLGIYVSQTTIIFLVNVQTRTWRLGYILNNDAYTYVNMGSNPWGQDGIGEV